MSSTHHDVCVNNNINCNNNSNKMFNNNTTTTTTPPSSSSSRGVNNIIIRYLKTLLLPSEEERIRISSLYRTTTTTRPYYHHNNNDEHVTADDATAGGGAVADGDDTSTAIPLLNIQQQHMVVDSTNNNDDDDYIRGYKPRYLYRYINVIRWLLLLLAGYTYNRFFAEKYNIPKDCDKYTYLGHSTNIANLVMFGMIQAWFVEVIDDPKRCKWIFSFNRWWFFIIYFASSSIFTILGMLDSLSHGSITPSPQLDHWNTFSIVLTILAGLLIVIIIWHIWYSIKLLPTYSDAMLYILSRIGVVSSFGIAFALIHYDDKHNHDGDDPVTFHLHHYFIAWLLSLIAAFDHPISLIMLAITCAIFVQGIAAYSAAGIFFRPGQQQQQ